MDIYIKKAIIHQFSPDDTELFLADKLLNITPKIVCYMIEEGIFFLENPSLGFI